MNRFLDVTAVGAVLLDNALLVLLLVLLVGLEAGEEDLGSTELAACCALRTAASSLRKLVQ